MKTERPHVSHGGLAQPEESRFPVCDDLSPSLEKEGKGWILETARTYESICVQAVGGGPTPSVDSVIQQIEPDRQNEIRNVLEAIAAHYTAEQTLHQADQVDTKRESSSPTCVQASEHAGPGEDVTMDSQGSNPLASEYEAIGITLDGTTGSAPMATTLAGSGGSSDPADSFATIDSAIGHGDRKSVAIFAGERAIDPVPGYKIKKVLGRGGMGVVYLAEQEGIDRLVALKMILTAGHADQVMLDRFQTEARAIGRFQHENIVRIFDYGTHEGMPYFSLEFVDGNTLSGLLKGQPIEPMEAAKLLEPMARAMQYAHDAGVIHRDLKPANILLTSDGVPKITDFGLAKELETDENLSISGSILGTPAYMAPEQARGENDVGPLADIYGLGAVLYCMVTGRPPFQGAKTTDTLIQVLNHEPVDPVKLQPGIPKDLETICLKCLQKDKSQRYTGAGELADDLGKFIRGEPISARPISRPERVWRWCKRNPRIAIASGLAASLALIVMIGGPASTAVIWRQKKEVVAAKVKAEANEEVAVANEQKAILAKEQADLAKEQADLARNQADLAKEQADENAEAASVQEKNAIDALKSMTFVVQKKLIGRRDLQQLRKELLITVRNGLKRMAEFEDTAREQDMIAAGIYVRLGELHMEVGQADKAQQEYTKTLAIFDKLSQENALPYAESNESKIYQLLGDAARKSGDLDTANDYHKQSLKIRRDWVKKTPEVRSTTNLAVSLGKLGSIAQVRGNLTEARQYMNEAVTVRQELLQENPGQPSALNELLGAELVLGKVQFQQGEVEEGTARVEQVVEKMRDRATQNPQSVGAQQDSAMCTAELGVMQLYQQDVQNAEESFSRAVESFEKLKAQLPEDIRVHEELEDATYGLAVTLEQLNKIDDSKKAMERLLELRRQTAALDDNNIAYHLRLLIALARNGDLSEGATLAGQLNEAIPKTDTIRYDLSCAYALLARAREEMNEEQGADAIPSAKELRESAIECLQQAIAAGFARPTDLKLDPDLAPIRDMPEFFKLQAEI